MIRKLKDKISGAQTVGSIQTVGFFREEVSVKLVKKKLFSDKPLIRVEIENLESSQSADLSVQDALKLVNILKQAIEMRVK